MLLQREGTVQDDVSGFHRLFGLVSAQVQSYSHRNDAWEVSIDADQKGRRDKPPEVDRFAVNATAPHEPEKTLTFKRGESAAVFQAGGSPTESVPFSVGKTWSLDREEYETPEEMAEAVVRVATRGPLGSQL